MAERDDLTLLENIAQRRDRDSYDELYSRYEKRAYNLAVHLTRNHDLAQDAVQDAMLDVWLHASSYLPGNEAGWIMRIVAHKSLTLARRRKQEGKKMAEQEATNFVVPAGNSSPAGLTERGELLQALRETLAGLPLLDQQVLALRFAGDLTQAEIGAALSLSHAAISARLAKACDQVRARLAHAGFAAALPLVSADGLCEAICSGYEVPQGLHEMVLESMAHAARKSLQESRRVVAARSWGQGVFLPAGLALAAAALVTLWWAFGSKPAAFRPEAEVPSVPLQAPVPRVPVSAPQAGPSHEYSLHVNFNTPMQASHFTVTTGSWRHLPDGGPDGSGCMETGALLEVALELPLEQLPLKISYRMAILPPENQAKPPGAAEGWVSLMSWDRYSLLVDFGNLSVANRIPMGTRHWSMCTTFVTRQFIAALQDRALRLEITEPVKGARMLLAFRGRHLVDDLTISRARVEELPDVTNYLAALERIEPSRRAGRVTLPEFRYPDSKGPVTIDFYPPTDKSNPVHDPALPVEQ